MENAGVKTYQLSELADFIRRVFALNLPSAVWISAEIGQANLSRGNCWLALVEKDDISNSVSAKLDAVVWKSQYALLQRKYGIKLLRDLLRDGMSVRLKVTTSFHPRYGLRLVVEEIDPSHTIGELERRRQQTLEALKREGLLGKNGQIPLSQIPMNLAVISSDTAAGLADFKAQLAANNYGYQFNVRLFPAAMQGSKTGPEIISRLRQITQWPESFDAVIIIRGGGGRTDLAAFDDEDLARQVANHELPVIVGIGHETDAAVLDVVAHTSLKTPTAVAAFLIEKIVMAEYSIIQIGRDICRVTAQTLYHQGPALDRMLASIHYAATLSLSTAERGLSQTERELNIASEVALERESSRIDGLETLLAALRPETTLARGFALVSQDGKLISSAKQLQPGRVEVRFKDDRATFEQD